LALHIAVAAAGTPKPKIAISTGFSAPFSGTRHGQSYAGDGFIAGAGAGACQHEQQKYKE
jgi:hypothetical protein